MDEQAWLRKGAAILTDIKEWRRAHPTATFVEIEDEIHRRMMELEAHVLQDAAQESESREWGKSPGQSVLVCPACAVPLRARGTRQRTLQGNGEQSMTLSRTYGTCPLCQKSFFPLDRELALLPGSLAPRQQEHLVHLASCLPFEQATRMRGDLLGVQVSAETARRLAEQMGAWMEVAQAASVSPPSEAPASSDQPAPERCVISVDGAMISLVHQQWVEVRTVAIGEAVEKRGTTGEAEAHVEQLSYFSSLSDASTFTERATPEMRRRNVAQAKNVCAVTDGAEWCQVFVEWYQADAVRILDFPHAAEHLSVLLGACEQAGLRFPDRMLSRCLHVLKHRGPARLLCMVERLAPELAQQKGIQEHVEYLRKREALMQYPLFRAQGWPIGSGMVESANKLVVQARLKGPGMHWERTHVNPMLAVCNDRWAEMWAKTLAVIQRRSNESQAASPEQPRSPHPSGSPSSTPVPRDPAGCLAQQAHVRQAGRCSSLSARPSRLPPKANPEASKTTAEAPVCWSCGAQMMHVRGHRKRFSCSDACRTRAYRARCSADSFRRTLAQRIKQEVLTRLPCTPIKRLGSPHPSRQPFVKERADRCRGEHASGGSAGSWASAQAVLFSSLSHASASLAANSTPLTPPLARTGACVIF